MHTSVLLHESIEGLSITPSDTVLDATVGSGGHSAAMAALLDERGTFIGLDLDQDALARASARIKSAARVVLVAENYRNLDAVLDEVDVASVDKVMFDLGISSNQLEESGRGFSFQRDEPLQMTLKRDPGEGDLTAREIVNEWDPENIEEVIRSYGEERFAHRIAQAIAQARSTRPIERTGELVDIITHATPPWYRKGRLHPATRTFQALRITVNDELRGLTEGLEKALARLNPSGRIAVISFHRLEDRIVKNFFKEHVDRGIIHTKKPITPSREEVVLNPRARSAKLRIFEKRIA